MSKVDYESLIVDLPDYPLEGIMFKDVTPVFADSVAFKTLVNQIAEEFMDAGVTKVVGAEARGLMLGAPVAYQLGVGFVPARKPGRLPRETVSEAYGLEYGTDELHIHADALGPQDKVLIVDDLVASGGTASVQVHLAEKCGAQVVGLAFLVELAYLNPREAIAKATDAPVYSAYVVEQEHWDRD